MPATVDQLTELMNVFKNQTPSSPIWYHAIDQVVGTLLALEIERAEARARDDETVMTIAGSRLRYPPQVPRIHGRLSRACERRRGAAPQWTGED